MEEEPLGQALLLPAPCWSQVRRPEGCKVCPCPSLLGPEACLGPCTSCSPSLPHPGKGLSVGRSRVDIFPKVGQLLPGEEGGDSQAGTCGRHVDPCGHLCCCPWPQSSHHPYQHVGHPGPMLLSEGVSVQSEEGLQGDLDTCGALGPRLSETATECSL